MSFVLPPKEGPFQSKQGSFGFQVYISPLRIGLWELFQMAFLWLVNGGPIRSPRIHLLTPTKDLPKGWRHGTSAWMICERLKPQEVGVVCFRCESPFSFWEYVQVNQLFVFGGVGGWKKSRKNIPTPNGGGGFTWCFRSTMGSKESRSKIIKNHY